VGRARLPHAINLQPIQVECNGAGKIENAALMAFGKNIAAARVQSRPRFAAVNGSLQAPVSRISLLKIVDGSQRMRGNHLAQRPGSGIGCGDNSRSILAKRGSKQQQIKNMFCQVMSGN
jgi:hypothetical protein